ncbi:hypothetical protein [Microbacterium karelineae]|uniref:hypothetical protein n=1 Tax=Microbacterium karelineae TaxID=2654283 RepID=UPI0012E9C19E|nr:hypothetical protein [Microbacterium karelineae]
MVTDERNDRDPRPHAGQRISRDYVHAHAGAPPVPPPGGYRGERRFPDHPVFGDALVPAAAPAPRPRAHPLGWVALLAAAVFGVILLGAIVSGATHLVFGTTVVALQLLVVAAIAAALAMPRGRILGAAALTLALVCNIGTAGAAGALVQSATGDYTGGLTQEDRERLGYPGIDGLDPASVLAAPSLEDVESHTAELSERIRTRLSDEFGYTWVQTADAQMRPERNGFGGESLLQQYISPRWRTEQPIHDDAEKRAVMQEIDAVLAAEGDYYELYALNEPDGSIDDATLESLYGSADPREQAVWEYATQRITASGLGGPEPTLLYASIIDLANDTSGDFRAREEATAEPGAPLEGLDLMFLSRQLLSEADRDAFAAGTGG